MISVQYTPTVDCKQCRKLFSTNASFIQCSKVHVLLLVAVRSYVKQITKKYYSDT